MIILGIFGSDPATEVHPRLWQGGFPREPDKLKTMGIDAIVLAAQELQPEKGESFYGLEIICAPMDDDGASPPSLVEWQRALLAAKRVIELHRDGKTVLVTCRMGLNRSGLVSALAIRRLTGVSGRVAAEQVREYRDGALSNHGFFVVLSKLGIPDAR